MADKTRINPAKAILDAAAADDAGQTAGEARLASSGTGRVRSAAWIQKNLGAAGLTSKELGARYYVPGTRPEMELSRADGSLRMADVAAMDKSDIDRATVMNAVTESERQLRTHAIMLSGTPKEMMTLAADPERMGTREDSDFLSSRAFEKFGKENPGRGLISPAEASRRSYDEDLYAGRDPYAAEKAVAAVKPPSAPRVFAQRAPTAQEAADARLDNALDNRFAKAPAPERSGTPMPALKRATKVALAPSGLPLDTEWSYDRGRLRIDPTRLQEKAEQMAAQENAKRLALAREQEKAKAKAAARVKAAVDAGRRPDSNDMYDIADVADAKLTDPRDYFDEITGLHYQWLRESGKLKGLILEPGDPGPKLAYPRGAVSKREAARQANSFYGRTLGGQPMPGTETRSRLLF